MSTTTLKLPYKRFIAQVSTGAPRSKSTYLAFMAENMRALKACPWREAADVPASLTGHDFTAKTQFSDAYDAFKLTGNYESSAMTEIAYAGMAAYRFTVPASAISGGVAITNVSLPISRDRFEAAGVHVAVAISSSAYPSDDWSVVRGSGAQAASALLTQNAEYLTAGSPASGTADIDLSDVASGNPSTYLWVYVTLEDYTSHWAKYNAKELRLYAIEGSAMLVGDSVDVTFDGVVSADSESGTDMKYLTKPIPVRVTHYEGYHRTSRPKICFSALSVMSGYEPLTSESVNSLPVKSILMPVATWTVPEGTGELPIDHMLATAGMRIPEGNYIIEAWIDETGDGKFTPGEPYGCSAIVGLTAPATPERIDIEVTEVHPNIVRMDIAKMIEGMPPPSARPEAEEGEVPDPYPVPDSQFATLAAATDRGRWNIPWATVEPAQYPGTSAPVASPPLTRIRIVRDLINGEVFAYLHNRYAEVLADFYLDLTIRSVITEADIVLNPLGRAKTVDMQNLNKAYNDSSRPSLGLTNATYRIVIGDGDVGDFEHKGNNLPVLFTNCFESLNEQTTTTPDQDLENKVYNGPLEVRFSHTNTIDKSFQHMRVRIYSDSDAETYISNRNNYQNTILYDSGVMIAPARDAEGWYKWTTPVRVGTEMRNNLGTFAPGVTYYWAVSMLDDKFTFFADDIATAVAQAETRVPFTFAAVSN